MDNRHSNYHNSTFYSGSNNTPTLSQTMNLAVDSESVDKASTIAIIWQQLKLHQIITAQSAGMMENIRIATDYQIIFDKVDFIIEIYQILII